MCILTTIKSLVYARTYHILCIYAGAQLIMWQIYVRTARVQGNYSRLPKYVGCYK